MATTKKTETAKAAPKKEKKVAAPKAHAAPKTAAPAKERYVYAVGRRKTAVAQVRFFAEGKAESFDIVVNGRSYEQYFNTHEQRQAVVAPFKAVGKEGAKVSVHLMGGGLSGQADAVKLGIARALVLHDELNRPLLKVFKLLTRDPRSVERKKPGLRKARRAPQWSKR